MISRLAAILAFVVLTLTSCNDNWLQMVDDTIRVTDNFIDVYNKAYDAYQNMPKDRSDEQVKNISGKYQTGDLLSSKDQQEVFQLFKTIGVSDGTCRLYVCKEDKKSICNPNSDTKTDCTCECYIK